VAPLAQDRVNLKRLSTSHFRPAPWPSYHTAAIVLRAARLSMAISRRSLIISALRPPCIVCACRIRVRAR
jgi:hypothetical protein